MIVCFDIGGSAIRAAWATSPHDLTPIARRPTPGDDFAAFTQTLRALVAAAPAAPRCVSISIAGTVDPETGRALVANIPCLDGRDMRHDLGAALGLPVIVANDADCFALAEATVGAGAGHRVVFGAILGTGVGGGLVVDGRLLNPAGGSGEWGHGPVSARVVAATPAILPALRCGCGRTGCLDATCGARGLEKLYAFLGGGVCSSVEILARWHAGDDVAGRTVAAVVEIVSGPLAMVVNLTGAGIVPVGGGLANDTTFIEAIDRATRPLTLRVFDRPLVVPAACRGEPGLVGAAILALGAPPRDRAIFRL